LDVVDLDTMPENDGPLIQMELLTKTGQKTVPNVFIRGQHIGGDSDLSEMFDSGSLERLLGGFDEAKGQEMR
jgi:glutaredoxin 3